MNTKPDPPIPIRMPSALLEKIQQVAKLMGKTQQEVMRLAMEIGLEDLKRCNYDIAGAIVDRAQRATIIESAMLAEDPVPYKATKRPA